MFANRETARDIAQAINSRWSELNLRPTSLREDDIAEICNKVLDSPSMGPRIVGDLSDKFTRPDAE